MKTNHRRGYVEPSRKTRWRNFKAGRAAFAEIAQRFISPKGFGFPDGPKEAARLNHGEKKYIRTRTRFHDNAALKKMADGADDESDL